MYLLLSYWRITDEGFRQQILNWDANIRGMLRSEDRARIWMGIEDKKGEQKGSEGRMDRDRSTQKRTACSES